MKEYILSNREAQAVDNYTINKLGFSGKNLMQNAGHYVAMKAKKLLDHVPGSRIEIFCGTGNNGGDGFVGADKLHEWGAHTHVWIIGSEEKIKGDAEHFYQQISEQPINIDFIQSADDLKKISDLHGSDLIIDALLGTGMKGKVKGIYADIIQAMNNAERPILAVDIPSGINGDTGKKGGIAVKAVRTITMGFLKRGLLYNDGPFHSGKVVVGDLGYPKKSYSVLEDETFLFHLQNIEDKLPKIPYDTYKHRMGKVLCFTGSPGMTGAAIMVSRAAQRSGAGLVVNAIPEDLNYIFETQLIEGLSHPVSQSEEQTFCLESLKDSREKIDWSDVVVFGPGVSGTSSALEFGAELITELDKPVIIDADGLKIFRENPELLNNADNIIITPHIGELSYITGESVATIKENIIDFGRDFAKKHSCTMVLKGPHTISFSRDGRAAVNTTGNPGLATGGTGDILTGMIAAFAAQCNDPFDAAVIGVATHGAAADKAVKDLGFRALIAGDLLKYIPKVLKQYDEILH